MARQTEARQRPPDDEWVSQHQRELDAMLNIRQPGYDAPPRASDPVAALSFVPAWAQGVGSFAGDRLRDAPGLRIGEAEPVKGALEGLGWLGENVFNPVVGAATAMAGAKFGNYEPLRKIVTAEDPRLAAGQYREESGEELRRIREDENEPLWKRAGAFVGGAAQLGFDAALPIAPGAGLVTGPLKTAAKARLAARGSRFATEADGALRVPDLDSEQLAARIGATSPAQQAHADNLAGEVAALDPAQAERIRMLEEIGILAPRPNNVIPFPKSQPLDIEPSPAGRASRAEERIIEMQRLRAEMAPEVGPIAPPLKDIPAPSAGPSGAEPTFGFQIEKFPAEVQPAMAKVADENAALLAQKTGPITWAETVRAAQEIGEPVERTAERLARHGVTSAELEAVRIGVAQKTRAAMEVAAKVARGTASPEEKLRGLMEMQEAATIQGRLHEAASEWGRTGAILRKQVDAELALGPSELAYRKAIAIIAREPGKADEFFQKLIAIDPSDTAALTRLLRDMNKADFWTRFDEYYKANLLWSPATHETNIVSGFYQQGLLAGRVALSRPTRIPDYIGGWLYGYKAAMDRIPAILSGAETADKWGGSVRAANPGKIGELIRIPYKALAIGDAFQTGPMYNGLIRIAAKDAAMKAGVKGAAQRQFIADFLADPPIGAKAAAVQTAEEFALHADSNLSSALLRMPRGLRYLTGALFIKTPVNLGKIGVRFSPLGALRPITERVFSGGAKTPAKQVFIESVAIGGAAATSFYFMLENGDMTGLYPRNRGEAQAWQAEGRGPLMIRASEFPMLGPLFRAIHGAEAEERWYTAGLLGPLLWPAMLAAATQKVTSDPSGEPVEKQVAMAAGAVGRALLDQIPMFQGYRRVNELLSDPVGAGVDYIGGLARGAIPAATLLATVERMTDTLKRKPEGVYETILAQIPVAGQNVRTAQDVLGRDVAQDNSGLLALLPRSSLERVHPVIQEQERLAKALGDDFSRLTKPTEDLGKVKLDPGERHAYAAVLGRHTEERLMALIGSLDYEGMSDAKKAKLWDKARTVARNKAKQEFASSLLGDMPGGREPRTPDQLAKGVVIGLSALTRNYDRALAVDDWMTKYGKDPDFTNALRENWSGSASEPSLDDHLTVAPLLKQMEKMPRFADGNGRPIGDERHWKQYDIERREWKRIQKDPTLGYVARRLTAQRYLMEHPVLRYFLRLAYRQGRANPQITLLKRHYPILERFKLPTDPDDD